MLRRDGWTQCWQHAGQVRGAGAGECGKRINFIQFVSFPEMYKHITRRWWRPRRRRRRLRLRLRVCLTARCRSCHSRSDACAATHSPRSPLHSAPDRPALLSCGLDRTEPGLYFANVEAAQRIWRVWRAHVCRGQKARAANMIFSCHTRRCRRHRRRCHWWLFSALPENILRLKKTPGNVASGCGTRHANKTGPRPIGNVHTLAPTHTHTHAQPRKPGNS